MKDFLVLEITEFDKICLPHFSILKQDGEIKISLLVRICYLLASLMFKIKSMLNFLLSNLISSFCKIFSFYLSTVGKCGLILLSLTCGDLISSLGNGFVVEKESDKR